MGAKHIHSYTCTYLPQFVFTHGHCAPAVVSGGVCTYSLNYLQFDPLTSLSPFCTNVCNQLWFHIPPISLSGNTPHIILCQQYKICNVHINASCLLIGFSCVPHLSSCTLCFMPQSHLHFIQLLHYTLCLSLIYSLDYRPWPVTLKKILRQHTSQVKCNLQAWHKKNSRCQFKYPNCHWMVPTGSSITTG